MNFQIVDSANEKVFAQKHTLVIPMIGKNVIDSLNSIIEGLICALSVCQTSREVGNKCCMTFVSVTI